MQTFVQDRQSVSETEATLFEIFQNGSVEGFVTLQNNGANAINYRFQANIGNAWYDLSDSGTDLYDTLSSSHVIAVKLDPAVTQSSRVRLVGNASGGSVISFSVSRYFVRESGGSIPILSL